MMRRIATLVTVAATLFLCSSRLSGQSTALAGRQVESGGGYSFQPPAGWKMVSVPALKYAVAAAAPVQGFTPNMVFVDEIASETMAQLIARNLSAVRQMSPDFKKLSEADFKVAAGTAVKVVGESTQQGRRLQVVFYFLRSVAGRTLVVTCTSPAQSAEDYAGMFDMSIQSFQWEQAR